MGKKERAQERREKETPRNLISRTIPYSDHTKKIPCLNQPVKGFGVEINEGDYVDNGTISSIVNFSIHGGPNDTIAVVTEVLKQEELVEISHQLASHGLTVVLTSRETRVGEEATKIMQEEGKIWRFRYSDQYAGVNFNFGFGLSVEFAETVIRTNYLGTKIKAMIPLMRPSPFGARIINVTSRWEDLMAGWIELQMSA
ncbi:hypothetical protein HAX54_003551 [Datura stramonium]|uniref:Uncharacterized protein n=1 Tax=Datura stramonium TaxID=4076 RepID=A0ABS8T5H2_DATST|nr:hypothetical protein [Datura stramonium]